jgi:hypothetical protein
VAGWAAFFMNLFSIEYDCLQRKRVSKDKLSIDTLKQDKLFLHYLTGISVNEPLIGPGGRVPVKLPLALPLPMAVILMVKGEQGPPVVKVVYDIAF